MRNPSLQHLDPQTLTRQSMTASVSHLEVQIGFSFRELGPGTTEHERSKLFKKHVKAALQSKLPTATLVTWLSYPIAGESGYPAFPLPDAQGTITDGQLLNWASTIITAKRTGDIARQDCCDDEFCTWTEEGWRKGRVVPLLSNGLPWTAAAAASNYKVEYESQTGLTLSSDTLTALSSLQLSLYIFWLV